MCRRAHAVVWGDGGRFLTSTFNRGMARNSRLRASFSALLQSRARRLGTVKIHRDHILRRDEARHHHRCPGAWGVIGGTICRSSSMACARGVQAIRLGASINNETAVLLQQIHAATHTLLYCAIS